MIYYKFLFIVGEFLADKCFHYDYYELTFGLFVSLFLLVIFHYIKNENKCKNLISDFGSLLFAITAYFFTLKFVYDFVLEGYDDIGSAGADSFYNIFLVQNIIYIPIGIALLLFCLLIIRTNIMKKLHKRKIIQKFLDFDQKISMCWYWIMTYCLIIIFCIICFVILYNIVVFSMRFHNWVLL